MNHPVTTEPPMIGDWLQDLWEHRPATSNRRGPRFTGTYATHLTSPITVRADGELIDLPKGASVSVLKPFKTARTGTVALVVVDSGRYNVMARGHLVFTPSHRARVGYRPF